MHYNRRPALPGNRDNHPTVGNTVTVGVDSAAESTKSRRPMWRTAISIIRHTVEVGIDRTAMNVHHSGRFSEVPGQSS